MVGARNEWLTPIVFTYNGSTDVPVNAGSYAVVGSYAGSANSVTVSGTGLPAEA